MHIILNNTSMIPIYEQMVDQIKNLIVTGELKEDEALPSVRKLATTLKISALTVKKAYDRLEEEGLVHTVHGKGTYVAPMNQALALEARSKAVEEELEKVVDKARSIGLSANEIREMLEIILDE